VKRGPGFVEPAPRTARAGDRSRPPAEARAWLARVYTRDRTENQPVQIILGVEKAGIMEQLKDWFAAYHFPILVLGGYSG
jgi:hypothetical protein